MNDPISHYTSLQTQMTALEVCWCRHKGMLYLFCVRHLIHVLMFLLLFVLFGCCVQCWVAGWRETWSAAGRWARCAWSQLCLSGPGPPGKEYLQYHSLLWGGVRVSKAGENERLEYYKNKCRYHISLLMWVSGFLPALYAIWLTDWAAKEKVTAISWSDSLVEPLYS